MKIIALTILFGLIYSCNSPKQMNNNQSTLFSPHVYIYKTKGDYYSKVPILLSETKEEIISYPDPSDLLVDNKLCLPTKLENGYLLDNRGININVAFINLDYSEYSKMENPPRISEIKQMIIDIDPLLEFYDCGICSKYKDKVKEINEIISNNQVGTFKRIK